MSENTKYKMLQAFHQMMMCIIQAYCSYYLFGYSFSATQAGLLSALAGLAAMVLQPAFGSIADHSEKWNWKGLLILLAIVSEISLVIVLVSSGKVLTGIFYAVTIACVNIMFPMINAASFYYSSLGIHVDFGIARGIGSLSYALLSLLLGRLTLAAGRPAVPVSGIITMGALLIVAILMPFYTGKTLSGMSRTEAEDLSGADRSAGNHVSSDEIRPEGKAGSSVEIRSEGKAGASDELHPEEKARASDEIHSERKAGASVEIRPLAEQKPFEARAAEAKKEAGTEKGGRRGFVRRNPAFMVMVTGCLLALSFHNMYNFYLINIIERVGGNTASMGTTLFLMAMLELPVMFSMSRVVKKISPAVLLVISCFSFAVKGIIYVTATSMSGIYIAGLFQILTFALIASASAYYTEEQIAPEDRVTGQGYMSLIFSGSTAIGNLLGGWLIDSVGLQSMLMIGTGIAVISGVLALASVRMLKKPANKNHL